MLGTTQGTTAPLPRVGPMTRRKEARKKPSKPYPEFPLVAHPGGQWVKKIRGKLCYFGTWDDWQSALEKYNRHRDALYAGQTPPSQLRTLGHLSDEWLAEKRRAADLGELSASHLAELERVAKIITDTLGRGRALEGLHLPGSGLREALAKSSKGGKLGPVAFRRRLVLARGLFKLADLRTGGELRPPPERLLRQARAEVGERWYSSPEDLRALVEATSGDLRAFIILGLSAGFGPQDCATVPPSAFDGEWIRYPRAKTGVERLAWRWPELVNLPPYRERSWDRFTIAQQFAKVCEATGVENLGFYSLRRTLATVAAAGASQPSIDSIMGHYRPEVSARYRQKAHGVKSAGKFVRGWFLGEIDLED